MRIKPALLGCAFAAAFGCKDRNTRDAAVAGAGAGAPVASAPEPQPQTQTQKIDSSGTTNLNTGAVIHARRTPVQVRGTSMGFGTRYNALKPRR